MTNIKCQRINSPTLNHQIYHIYYLLLMPAASSFIQFSHMDWSSPNIWTILLCLLQALAGSRIQKCNSWDISLCPYGMPELQTALYLCSQKISPKQKKKKNTKKKKKTNQPQALFFVIILMPYVYSEHNLTQKDFFWLLTALLVNRYHSCRHCCFNQSYL